MRERPILFSGDMVRAILEGRKTVTRRKVNPQPDFAQAGDTTSGAGFCGRFTPDDERLGRLGEAMPCPFGQPGDRLWVRETFNRTNPGGAHGVYYYRADGCFPSAIGGRRFYGDEAWKPSIHMPRAASRIMLEVTAVRVERLQDITEEQAKAEGVRAIDGMKWHTLEEAAAGIPMRDHTALDAFSALWECINGEGSCAANPWVWVVEFKRAEASHA